MADGYRSIVDFILLGPLDDRRQVQESPILGDVWMEFAAVPAQALDLLISPFSSGETAGAGPLAKALAGRLDDFSAGKGPQAPLRAKLRDQNGSNISYLQGIVAARLFFDELIEVVIPMTFWWKGRADLNDGAAFRIAELSLAGLAPKVDAVRSWLESDSDGSPARRREAEKELGRLSALERYLILAGLLLWAGSHAASTRGRLHDDLRALIKDLKSSEEVTQRLASTYERMLKQPKPTERETYDGRKVPALFYQVSSNRRATAALARSVPAVKGDAARTLFDVKCDKIVWGVIDSGIDGSHPAFGIPGKVDTSRVIRAFDFTRIREIINLDNLATSGPGKKQLAQRADEFSATCALSKAEIQSHLKRLAEDSANERPIHWELVEPFLAPAEGERPSSGHGTHVAGILGANRQAMLEAGMPESLGFADGMCPDIGIYDFRVLSQSEKDTEFAIIAALQYLRHINERHALQVVHGVNLSLSIRHDVRNYACGRTPICDECDRLVSSGTVVVAAAGNRGYRNFSAVDGADESYAAFSITDPGNAESVITVGSTHRFWPHTYGVSFFSSRGPTGDGRLKPDLVAPGERIESALPGDGSGKWLWGALDGTSMAAPHVSGAAAMLMARYSELIGAPRKIKQILCETATNLERERSFQGNGMLDILRAFQKI